MHWQRGFILPSVLAILAVSLVVGALALVLVLGNLRNTQAAIVATRAHLAAEAGLEEGIAEIWHRLWGNTPPSQRTIQEYIQRVEGRGSSWEQQGTLPDGSSFTVRVERIGPVRDSGNRLVGYRLRLLSIGQAPGQGVRRLEQEVLVGRRFFPFEYAILTNNLNCILCHTDIASIDALRGNPDPNNRATWWRRAKVATLEHIEARHDTNTTIHGTLYTRGNVTLRGETPTLYTTLQDGIEEIRSTQRRQLGAQQNGFQATDCSNLDNCLPRRPLYQNYPTSGRLGNRNWPDGELVDSFLLPIPDANANRRIDDDEWQAAVSGSVSGGSDDYPSGSLRARMAVLGGILTDLGWGSASSDQTVQTDTLAGTDSWRLVVIDAAQVPLEIRGTVFINGDVILRGRVRGNGTLLARGNIYVMGDLTYDCGQGTQLANCDYRDPSRLPALSLVAGGNVVIGDYLSRFRLTDDRIPNATWAGNLNNPLDVEAGFEGGFPPGTFAGCAQFWASRPSGTGLGQWTQDSRNALARCTVPNLAAMEVGNFNRLELLRAHQAGENYVPRFYRFDGDDGIFYYSGCGEHTRNYAQYKKLDGSEEVSFRCTDANHSFRATFRLSRERIQQLLQRAVVVDVHLPSIPKSVMKQLWLDSVQLNPARPAGPLRLDGLIYSPNAVFSLAPGNGNFSGSNGDVSKVQGKIDHRGSIVAADTGMLAPSGFMLYHDARLRPRVPFDQNLSLFRQAWTVKASR